MQKDNDLNGFDWLVLALLIFLGLDLQSAHANGVSHPDFADEAGAGLLILQKDDPQNGKQKEAALHVRSHADIEINGLTAHVILRQSFSNHTDAWQEGVYVFPLPENAAVNHMAMRIGEREIIGKIKEKAIAKAIYQQAKQAGKRAALTEQLRPNLFTQRVANIGPKESIEVELHFVQTLEYDSGRFAWTLPTTITPRYFPRSTEPVEVTQNQSSTWQNGWASQHAVSQMGSENLPSTIESFQQHLNGRKHYNPITLNIALNVGMDLQSISAPYHDLDIEKKQTATSIRLKQGEANMDRDFVLHWRPVPSSQPQAALFSEQIDGAYYSLLMMLPPQKSNRGGLPRDVMFVIDTSGSMAGASIKQAKRSLILALERLTPSDQFNVIEFNSGHRNLFDSARYADTQNKKYAMEWIQKLNANGGTQMHGALNAAFDSLEKSHTSDSLQQLVFITDGAVSNEQSLLKSIHQRLGNSRLFTVAIGSAPNHYFMKKAAQFGRGTFTHIGNSHEIEADMGTLLNKLEHAAAKQLSIQWPGASESYPKNIPDLYANEPLLIAVRSESLHGEVIVEGQTAHTPWRKNIKLDQPATASSVSTLWARRKIEALEDERLLGADEQEIKEDIIDIALRHKLLTQFTSFVAVEQRIARDPERLALKSTPIANATPAGHASLQVRLPQTATNAEIGLWFGLFFIFIAILIQRFKDE